MRIYGLPGQGDGPAVAFEIPNWFLTGRQLRKIVHSIGGSEILRQGPYDDFPEEGERLAFRVGDVVFSIVEPFGDNSRLWVGPYPVRPVPELATVRDAFARSTLWTRLLPFAT